MSTNDFQMCLFCGGNALEPDHALHCDGKQGGIEEPPDGYCPTVVAHTDDPETSHAAAATLNEDPARLTRAIAAVVELLTAHGPLTDFDLREHWREAWDGGFSYTLPCKARVWAREAGQVRWSGHHAKNPTSGYTVRVWELGRDDPYLERARCPTCGRPNLIRKLHRKGKSHDDVVPERPDERH